MTGVLLKEKRSTGTQRQREEVPEKTEAEIGMSRNAGNHQKPGERSGTDYPSEHPEGTNFADTVISDFCSSELLETRFPRF